MTSRQNYCKVEKVLTHDYNDIENMISEGWELFKTKGYFYTVERGRVYIYIMRR